MPLFPPASQGGGGNAGVIYQQGGVSSGNVLATWVEVQAAVVAANGDLAVTIDDSITASPTVPAASGLTDGMYRMRLLGPTRTIPKVTLTIEDGATLHALASVEGLRLLCDAQTVPSLSIDAPAAIKVAFGGSLEVGPLATIPPFPVPVAPVPGTPIAIFVGIGSELLPGAVELFDVAAGAVLALFMFANNSAAPASNVVTGPPGSVLVVLRDASQTLPPQAGFAGTIIDGPFDNAAAMPYTDSAPLLGSDNVQGAIDALKILGSSQLLWGAGNVAASTTTRYLVPGFDAAVARLTPVQWRLGYDQILSAPRVRHNDPAGNGGAIVYTLRINGAPTALTLSLASTGSDADDTTQVAASAGDLVDIEVTKALATGSSPDDVIFSVNSRRI
jgi:hypothetical protein